MEKANEDKERKDAVNKFQASKIGVTNGYLFIGGYCNVNKACTSCKNNKT